MSSREERILELAYNEAQRAVQEQSVLHLAIPNRAAIVAAVNALVGSLLASDALKSAPIDADGMFLGFSPLEILAVSCLIGSLVFAVQAVIPRSGWEMGFSPSHIVEYYCDSAHKYTLADTYRYISQDLEASREHNDKMLRQQLLRLQMSLILGSAQTIFWLLDLRS